MTTPTVPAGAGAGDPPTMTGRERALAHLRGAEADRLPAMPITMMFAAAHSGVAYCDYCTDFRRLVAGQIAVAEAYGFDHVSCISDPAREASDLGAAIHWFDDQPPALDETNALLADPDRLATLVVPDPASTPRMGDRIRAAALFHELVGERFLVEGWVEGPCAEAADLRGLNTLMLDFADDPALVRAIFEFTTELGIRFALAQIDAGVDIVGVGDAAASLVGPAIYEEFVLPYERRLVDAIHGAGAMVRLHICGNTRRVIGAMASIGCEVVDVDYPVPMAEARAAGPLQMFAGNLEPVGTVMNGSPDRIAAALEQCHADAGPRYVVSAGCEIPRVTAPANVRALGAYAHATRP